MRREERSAAAILSVLRHDERDTEFRAASCTADGCSAMPRPAGCGARRIDRHHVVPGLDDLRRA